MSESRRRGQAVLITGASTGIGAAAAVELARQGFRVFAGVRRPCDGDALKALSPKIVPVVLDVTSAEQIAAAANTLRDEVGEDGLWGLVNNAGIVVAGPLEVLPIEQLRLQLDVNVVGLVAVTQSMLPLLRKARGRIVNIGSLNGRIASPYMAPYAASKHALEAISDALRVELRNWGIDVSLIEPGATSTPIWQKSISAADTEANSNGHGLQLYETDLLAMRAATLRLAETALPVESVTRCIVHALTARRPRTRYPVGLRVNLLCRAHKWVPSRIWDWIIARALGLP